MIIYLFLLAAFAIRIGVVGRLLPLPHRIHHRVRIEARSLLPFYFVKENDNETFTTSDYFP